MTYTKAQLEAMQAAGVPVEGKYSDGSWRCQHWSFTTDLDTYRPSPGYAFGSATAKALVAAEIRVERLTANGWDADDVRYDSKCWTYRIANTAAEPTETPADEIRRLRRQNDVLTEAMDKIEREQAETQCALGWAQEESNRWQKQMDTARNERDDALAKLNALKAALKGVL
jgi:hypothetical protein